MTITTSVCQRSGSPLEQAGESHSYLAFFGSMAVHFKSGRQRAFTACATLDPGSWGPRNSYYHQWSPQTLISAIFEVVFLLWWWCFFSFVFCFNSAWCFAGGSLLPIFYFIFKAKQWKRGNFSWERRLLTLKLVSDVY